MDEADDTDEDEVRTSIEDLAEDVHTLTRDHHDEEGEDLILGLALDQDRQEVIADTEEDLTQEQREDREEEIKNLLIVTNL